MEQSNTVQIILYNMLFFIRMTVAFAWRKLPFL